jgi:hypothetical protein
MPGAAVTGSRLNEAFSGVLPLLLTVLPPVWGPLGRGRGAFRRAGADRIGAGQAARAGGPLAPVHRFSHDCSR